MLLLYYVFKKSKVISNYGRRNKIRMLLVKQIFYPLIGLQIMIFSRVNFFYIQAQMNVKAMSGHNLVSKSVIESYL